MKKGRKEGRLDLFALNVQLLLIWYIFPLMHAFKSALPANAPLLSPSFALHPAKQLTDDIANPLCTLTYDCTSTLILNAFRRIERSTYEIFNMFD